VAIFCKLRNLPVAAVNYFLLDGLNIVRGASAFRSFMPHNIAGAMAEFERILSAFFAFGADRILLVYDGGAGGQINESILRNKRMAVILTAPGRSADIAIVDLCRKIRGRKRPPKVTVVSDDGGLGAATAPYGVDVISCETFMHQLDEREECLRLRMCENSKKIKTSWPHKLGDRIFLSDGKWGRSP
jgi:predicted RNA-binding protein with PIN domain